MLPASTRALQRRVCRRRSRGGPRRATRGGDAQIRGFPVALFRCGARARMRYVFRACRRSRPARLVLARAHDEGELGALLDTPPRPRFDIDVTRLLIRRHAMGTLHLLSVPETAAA